MTTACAPHPRATAISPADADSNATQGAPRSCGGRRSPGPAGEGPVSHQRSVGPVWQSPGPRFAMGVWVGSWMGKLDGEGDGDRGKVNCDPGLKGID